MNTDGHGKYRTRISPTIIGGLLIVLLLSAGCWSARMKKGDAAPPPLAAGEILRVNEAERLVVVRAAVLPEAGQEATVFGKEGAVGRIRFTAAQRPPYTTAEILEGRPRRGDQFRVEAADGEHRSTP